MWRAHKEDQREGGGAHLLVLVRLLKLLNGHNLPGLLVPRLEYDAVRTLTDGSKRFVVLLRGQNERVGGGPQASKAAARVSAECPRALCATATVRPLSLRRLTGASSRMASAVPRKCGA